MIFHVGQQYGLWRCVEHGKSKLAASCCHLCGKYRREWYRFERYTITGELVNYTELGTECVNKFDFTQDSPYGGYSNESKKPV